MRENLLLMGIAYPEISKKYKAAVCMAGITDSGEFRRIYPVPFDKFYRFGFHKKQWINYEIREKGDYRKESYKIFPETLHKGDKVTDEDIKQLCLKNVSSIEELKSKWKVDKSSLGIIKPQLEDIKIKLRPMDKVKENWNKQSNFNNDSVKIDILNYDIRYQFKCSEECGGHKCMCLDTESGQLYRNLVKRWGINNEEIVPKMKYRLFDWMQTRDLFFMMGTHSLHPTSWMIISLIYPPFK